MANGKFLGEELVSITKEFLEAVSKELDPFTSKQGEIEVGNEEVVLLTPSHIQYAKYGRGPGKRPPLDAILEYVGTRGIIFEGKDERGTAFAIQASIGKNGTKNWKPGAPNALEEAIQKNLNDYNARVSNLVTISVADEVNEIYKTILPKSEFKY